MPSIIKHIGKDYDLMHLAQRFFKFDWKCADGQNCEFSVRVRYSDHCISDGIKVAPPQGSCLFGNPPKQRVFDLDRHTWSLELPTIIENLIAKPTTALQLTPEGNGYIFRLTMAHSLQAGEKYYCFIRVKRSQTNNASAKERQIDLYVESAYSRQYEPDRTGQRIMLGKLAENIT